MSEDFKLNKDFNLVNFFKTLYYLIHFQKYNLLYFLIMYQNKYFTNFVNK